MTGHLVQMEADAAEAERVLLAREAAHQGWGRTASQIATIRTRKEKAARKAFGM